MILDPVEVEAFLQAAARAGAPVTYAQTLEALGHRFTRPLMRQLCRVLGDVDARAAGSDQPALAVLVVRQSDGMPGQGWWAAHTGWTGDWTGPEARRYVGALQARAFRYWAARS